MHLALYVAPNGFHFGGWRYPGTKVVDPLALQTYIDIAKTAERGCFDLLFMADKLARKECAIERGLARRVYRKG